MNPTEVTAHPDYRAFLAAIRREPTNRTLKLVLADWLEEHDQEEWAAWLRARNGEMLILSNPYLTELLYDSDRQELRFPEPRNNCSKVTEGTLVDGCLQELLIDSAFWLMSGDHLYGIHPINAVIFRDEPDMQLNLTQSPDPVRRRVEYEATVTWGAKTITLPGLFISFKEWRCSMETAVLSFVQRVRAELSLEKCLSAWWPGVRFLPVLGDWKYLPQYHFRELSYATR